MGNLNPLCRTQIGEVLEIAMIRLPGRLREAGLHGRMLLQVHEELVLEVPRSEVDATASLLRTVMEGAMRLDVPLTVDVKVGDDWEGMKPLTREDAVLAEVNEARSRSRRGRPAFSSCGKGIGWPAGPGPAALHTRLRGIRS